MHVPLMRRPTPIGLDRGEPRSRELSNLIICRVVSTELSLLAKITTPKVESYSLLAHVVVSSSAGVVQAASVVHGNVVSLLGEVNAVALAQSSLLNAHCERIAIELKERIVVKDQLNEEVGLKGEMEEEKKGSFKKKRGASQVGFHFFSKWGVWFWFWFRRRRDVMDCSYWNYWSYY